VAGRRSTTGHAPAQHFCWCIAFAQPPHQASHAGTAFGSYADVARLAAQVAVREVGRAE
jgi:hypothetical protein